MTRPHSDRLLVFLAPFDAVLVARDFRRVGAKETGGLTLSAYWETAEVLVSAVCDPHEHDASVMIGRRMSGVATDQQPYGTMVYLELIFNVRNRTLRSRVWPETDLTGGVGVRAWATAAAQDLESVSDLLVGRHLELIDKLLALH
jgi:hypothetical protein